MTERRLSGSKSFLHFTKRFSIENSSLYAIRDALDRLDVDGIPGDEMIEYSTAMLEELDDTRVSLLAARARAFQKQGALDKAIKDASEHIALRPMTVQGYVMLGGIYAGQGKYPMAISVLEEGLRSVLPSDWPLLYEEREAMKQSMSVKVDFVNILPPEVITRVFTLLPDNTLASCTLVSKQWRNVMLGYAELWKVVRFDWYNHNATASLLKSVSVHVKMLHINPSRNTKEYETVLELASTSMLSCVEGLVIEHYIFSKPQADYMHLTKLLGPQLTTFDLQCSDTWVDQNRDKPIFLDPLLRLCPNLRHLYLDFSRCRSYLSLDLSELSSPLELETLSTNFGERDHVLEQLIPQCPSLLSFHGRSIAPRTLSLLDQHCPSLKQLHIRPFYAYPPTKGRGQQSTSGLEEIYCILSDVSQIHSLAPLLVKSKDSLQVLGLQLTIPFSRISISEFALALPDIEYSQLKDFSCQAERFDDSISRIIRQCSTLKKVFLQIGGGSIPNDLFQALMNLSHLRRLEILARTDSGGLENFIAYHSALGQRSALETIQIHGCDSVTDEILHSLADLPTLQTIILQGPFLLTSSEGISTFVRKLEANTNLKYLSFEQIEDLTDSLAVDLEHATCLKMKKYLSGEPSFRGLYFGER